MGGLGRQRFPVRRPQPPIGVDRDLRLPPVDPPEQAPAQDPDRLVLLGRIEQRRLARRHALRLRHPVGDEPVLLAVRIAGPAVLADREGVDQRHVRCALHRLEQRGQERGQLVAGIVEAAHLAQIHRDLVEQDQGRFAAEQFPQGPGTRRHTVLVARAHPPVALPPGKGVGDLAPRGERQHAVAHIPPVGGIGVLTVEGRDANRPPRHQRGVHELTDVRDTPHPARRMHECDQPVGLAPAVGGVETEDRGGLPARAGQAPSHVGEQVPEAPRRIRPGEEAHGVGVIRPAAPRDHLRKIRREVGVGDPTPEDILPRFRGLEDRRDRHRVRSVPPFGPLGGANLPGMPPGEHLLRCRPHRRRRPDPSLGSSPVGGFQDGRSVHPPVELPN